jgi:hypothetical protein
MDYGIDESAYYTRLVTRVANALRDGFGARFKIVYEGDPIDVPSAMLPCIIVQKPTATDDQEATAMDVIVSNIIVKILVDKRMDFGSTSTQMVTDRYLEYIMEGRDPITYQYTADSVCGILRTNFTLGQTIVDQKISFNYDIGFRPKDLISAEARATFTFTELIQVPVRY